MAFSLPDLSYKYEDLEPHIDKETMKTHHSKHHQTYINKLNKTVEDNNIEETSLFNLLANIKDSTKTYSPEIKKSLINNGGGHYNHSLFWAYMSPSSSVEDINKELMLKINESFQSLDSFIKAFDAQAVGLFGSGWVWLCYDKATKKLEIKPTENQDSPIMFSSDLVPLLGLDVWEHAYYLKYKNNRPEYVSNWWNVVNWKFVSCIYENCVVKGKTLELTADGLVKFSN
ncbi:Superoxide dismutase [Mn/Fe] [Nosema granulosis]|uniref:Superoxide dismutase n=1 Tax=Nosema granulosis TaxID=83296 RepID=A0A9P6H1F3_9MICR|nr:Superoxide dismutase [Mn/Fe] [Nosema granulosis]